MKNLILLASMVIFSTFAFSQDIVGTWKTIDDESGQAKSHVEIYKQGDKYFGKVIKLLPGATTDRCKNCKGDKKDAPIEGMVVIENLKPYKDYYSYGTIFDPSSGKEYKCSAWIEDGLLNVRGYVGVSALGRTQIWHPIKK